MKKIIIFLAFISMNLNAQKLIRNQIQITSLKSVPILGTDINGNAKDNSSAFYNKTEVDNLIPVIPAPIDVSGKANISDVYNKTETYNKTEVDNLIPVIPAPVDISGKANISNVYNKTETYNKTEVDNLIPVIPAPVDISGKVDKVNGKSLTKNNFTDALMDQLVATFSQSEINQKLDLKLNLTEWDKVDRLFDFTSLNSDAKVYFEFAKYPTHCGAITKTDTNFNSDTGFIFSQGTNESSGAKFDGAGISMWSPMDTWALKLIDEDGLGTSFYKINSSYQIETSSDARLKTNITEFQDFDLTKFENIRFCSYEWKSYNDDIKRLKEEVKDKGNILTPEEKKALRLKNRKLKRLQKKNSKIGTIAQDIKKVFPKAVKKGANGYFSINEDIIKWSVYKVVQQLSLKIKDLENRIELLELE